MVGEERRVQGLRFRVQGLGFRVWGLGFRVWGLGFRVWGLGFAVRRDHVLQRFQGMPYHREPNCLLEHCFARPLDH